MKITLTDKQFEDNCETYREKWAKLITQLPADELSYLSGCIAGQLLLVGIISQETYKQLEKEIDSHIEITE